MLVIPKMWNRRSRVLFCLITIAFEAGLLFNDSSFARASQNGLPGASPSTTDPVYAPLWLYQGTWLVTPTGLLPGAKPDQLHNDCGLIGKYFACQQTKNGKLGALVVFIPADKPGHYYTQAVLPEGWATGRGELEIEGDHWTYQSKVQEGDKTKYFRTANLFTGKDRIHYEQSESADGTSWLVKSSGDEIRSNGG